MYVATHDLERLLSMAVNVAVSQNADAPLKVIGEALLAEHARQAAAGSTVPEEERADEFGLSR